MESILKRGTWASLHLAVIDAIPVPTGQLKAMLGLFLQALLTPLPQHSKTRVC